MKTYKNTPLTGIFHSFTGTPDEAAKLLEFEGFMLGINGVVTFKKSTLPDTLRTVPLRAYCARNRFPLSGSRPESRKKE